MARGPGPTNGGDQGFANFLQEDYRLKVDYLKAQFDRMWKRFEIFLGLQSALFAFFFKFLPSEAGAGLRKDALLFGLLGLGSSLIGIFFGAQDRYLVNRYRDAAWHAGDQLCEYYSATGAPGSWAEVFTPVGQTEKVPLTPLDTNRRTGRIRGPVEWHSTFASTTMLPAEFALAVVGLWIATIVLFT
jgi:hypothetical protein